MIRVPRLYAVADATFGDPVEIARELFAGGVRLLQIRNKSASAKILLEQAETILRFAPRDAQVLVNDRADIARIVGAAGVHLGQKDLPPFLAKQVLADGQGIGYSTHDMRQAIEADSAPVDYIAVGPVFSTTTKQDPDPVLGLERLTEICARVRKPVVAIGGITLESSRDVLDCGAVA